MNKITKIPTAILEMDISDIHVLEYIKVLDPIRHENVDHLYLRMLIGMLKECGYKLIAHLHETVKKGWDKFIEYEVSRGSVNGQQSGTLTIFLVVMIADAKCRNKFCVEEAYKDLQPYFLPHVALS